MCNPGSQLFLEALIHRRKENIVTTMAMITMLDILVIDYFDNILQHSNKVNKE